MEDEMGKTPAVMIATLNGQIVALEKTGLNRIDDKHPSGYLLPQEERELASYKERLAQLMSSSK
jgi:hypothetical protein